MSDFPLFLYQLEDSNGMVYYYNNGVLSKKAGYQPLENNPIGWEDLTLSYATSDKYFLFSRTESVPQEFVRDSAGMLREILYTKRGFSEDVFLKVLQRDKIVYRKYIPCYYGKLSLSDAKDKVQESFTVDISEGGLAETLNAKDSTDYDVLCSENNPLATKIYFTPILLRDKYNYSIYVQNCINTSEIDFSQILGVAFLNSEGDSVRTLSGSPTPEREQGGTFYQDSSNYLFKSELVLTVKVDFTFSATFDNTKRFYVYLKTKTQSITVIDTPISGGTGQHNRTQVLTFSASTNVTLAPDEALFLVTRVQIDSMTGDIPGFTTTETALSISFDSRNTPSFAYSLDYITLMQALLDKASGTPGKYQFVSNFFTANPGLRFTCGDALRNTQRSQITAPTPVDDYYISTSIEDVFKAGCVEGPMCLMVQGNVLRMEPLGTQYGTGATILDAGEMSGVTISPLKEKIFGLIKVGYPDQNYDQRSGKYEFNQTRTFTAPTFASNNTLDITCPIRADCYGIEFIRSNYTGKDSTDNDGDKQPFLVDCDPSSQTAGFEATGTNRNSFLIIGNLDINRFAINGYFTISGGTPGDGTYRVYSVDIANREVTVWTGVIPGPYNGTVTFDSILLNRPAYQVISGVLDNSVFNTRISPKNVFLRWMSYINSIFFQQPGEQFTFSSGDKNIQLHTELNGITIDENDAMTIGSVDPAIFLPYQLEGTTEVPQTFLQIVSNLQKGDIRAGVNGKDVYCLPLFCKMSTKPALNPTQDWILTISTKTSLMTLLTLSNTGFTFKIAQNSVYMSDLQPIHWVDYAATKLPGIQHFAEWQEWEENRFPNYSYPVGYWQKWFDTDTIKMWFPTDGVASLVLYVYDKDAYFVNSFNIATLPSAAMSGTNVLKYLALPASIFPPGCYTFVIQSGTTPYLISRHVIKAWSPDIVDNTIIIKYRNSYNTNEYYQELDEIQIRVEGQQGIPKELADKVTYTDDLRQTVSISGRTYRQRPYYFGFPRGIPEWMAKKLNIITATMDNVTIEDLPVVRPADQQFDEDPIPGYNLIFPSIILDVGDNQQGRVINNVTGATNQAGGLTVIIDPDGSGNSNNFVEVAIN